MNQKNDQPTPANEKKDNRRNPPRSRCKTPTRNGSQEKKQCSPIVHRLKDKWETNKIKRSFQNLKEHVFQLFDAKEVDEIAARCGFRQRTPKEIMPFSFALCCIFASIVESKRGFAPIWRLLSAAADVHVARSAVTQRFGPGSAALMEELFELASHRLPNVSHPELLGKLEQFKQVLADDGSVLKLSPLLSKLFPACRTNSMDAAGKLHATADIVKRQIIAVDVTGERESELDVACSRGVQAGTLYIRDLGYTCYDLLQWIVEEHADVLMRLKDNANPKVVRVRHGVFAPRRSEGKLLNELEFTQCHDTFDLDAEFKTSLGSVVLRVVGHYNEETEKYHCYVTSLQRDAFTVEELENLYALRWVIELLFKLLKSSCHLDHLDTKNPHAVRTHIYASLLAATVLTATVVAAAESAGIPVEKISLLMVGIAAPLLVIPLMILWGEREITHDELAAMIVRTIAHGCCDQNPGRTERKWGGLS